MAQLLQFQVLESLVEQDLLQSLTLLRLALLQYQIFRKVAINEGKVIEKTYVPLALSYDHRVINGSDAGRFMVYLKDILESFND